MLDELDADELGPPAQAPTLSWPDEKRLRAGLARRNSLEWLMAPAVADVPASLEEILRRPAWQKDAACRGMGTAVFFPGRGESTVAAKAICAGCGVRQECLAAGLADSDTEGVWGGLSARVARRTMRGAVA
jgi:WhiB family redox-sensing transcriptional regulator